MGTRRLTAALLVLGCGHGSAPDPSIGTGDAPSSSSGAPSTDGDAGALGSTSSTDGPAPDAGASDPGAPAVEPSAEFVDVTVEAGLALDPGDLHGPPFCILDDVSAAGTGDYCIPERFLGAVAVGDYDGDLWPDVFLTRLDGPGQLMRNRGDGTFEDATVEAGLHQQHVTGGAAWIDIEGDGDLDLMLTSFGGIRHYLHVNDGRGSFDEQALERGAGVATGGAHVGMGIAVGDYDLDGYLDMFVADWHSNQALGAQEDHNRLLHNRGATAPGYFEDVTVAKGIDLQEVTHAVEAAPGAYGFAPAFVDLDGDSWPELALVADVGTSRLYWNDGGGGFVDLTAASGVGAERYGMGSAFGDYDGDGDLDWFVSSIWQSKTPADGNRLYRNEGDRTFVDVTTAHGVHEGGWGWGTTWVDADLDGDLDLLLASGWPSASFEDDPVQLWLNDGPGPWPEVATDLGIDFHRGGRGVVAFDYDRDGDLDILVHANTEPPALYRNDTHGGSWLQVRAVGRGGNPRSIGAEVRVQSVPDGPWQVRQIGVGGHLFGQSDAVAHFGLGAGDEPLSRIDVTWPTGRHVTLRAVDRNEELVVHE